MKKQILQSFYTVGGFRPFHFLNRKKLLILTYHRFSDHKSDFAVSAGEFEDHLRYLNERHTLISLDEAAECLAGDIELPPNPAVITIDDGYKDAYETAYPLLKKYSVPATLFVITDFLDGKCWLWTDLMRYALINTSEKEIAVEFTHGGRVSARLGSKNGRIRIADELNACLKQLDDNAKSLRIKEIAESMGVAPPDIPPAEFGPVTWDQAEEMDGNGVKIESHTVSHPILTKIDSERLHREIANSKSVISDRLGKDAKHFCYPNGVFDDAVRQAVADAGFVSAVTTNYGFCDAGDDVYALNRIDSQPAIESLAQSASGFESFREKVGI